MKKFVFAIAVVGAAVFAMSPVTVTAQCSTCASGGEVVDGGGVVGGDCSTGDCGGAGCRRCGTGPYVGPKCTGIRSVNKAATLVRGVRDHYSPRPFYAYGRHGVRAAWEHSWNENQAAANPWHGGYSHWRYQAPTALVVPPTAAFQSSYSWGVGQTRSLPINHQFGNGWGNAGGGDGQGMFAPTPYWPNSTEQFGVYPVRAPWN